MYTFTMVVRIVKGADFYKYAFSSMLSNENICGRTKLYIKSKK